MTKVEVLVVWDDDAGVWYVAESNLPGLAVEAKTKPAFERLIRRVVPELIALNGFPGGSGNQNNHAPAELIYKQYKELALSC